MYDLLIKGGQIADGTGAPSFTGDVAVKDGVIVAVGKVSGVARETVDADGLLVTPGWIDIHTHYDGQMSWDEQLAPSLWHGVSTAISGNCGVGFAPVKPDRHDWLIQMMEGVEDIPGTALSEGICWGWETFPEYLDFLDRRSFAIDVGCQIAHGPLRGYVMGERGMTNEDATPEDIAAMAAMVRQAQDAGSLGFTTSRTVVHRATDGEPVPGTFATFEELYAFAEAVVASGHGVMEVVPAGLLGEDIVNPARDLAWMKEISARTGCPITFLMGQNHIQPSFWRTQLDETAPAGSNGPLVRPQMFCRSIGVMVCLESRHHPFLGSPIYKELSKLPYAEMVGRLKAQPELRKAMALEGVNDVLGFPTGFNQWRGVYPLSNPANYEPAPETSIRATAKRENRDAREVALDILLSEDGKGFLHRPIMGYADGNLDPTFDLLSSAHTIPGGSDAGAHVATDCDAGAPTFLLTHWVRDRQRGPRLPLEHIVRKQSFDTASFYGLNDRGRIAPGLRADVNLIDYPNLQLGKLHMIYDLPNGAQRLMQKAEGYVATYVKGVGVTKGGEDTGARPGRLVRGAPAARTLS